MRYAHTNIVARDWKALAAFYQKVLGCIPVPPERDMQGPVVDALTGVPGAHITGMHLRLPGWGDAGPTLEIFQYNISANTPHPAINSPGPAHLAFEVDDVPAAAQAFLANGGSVVGQFIRDARPGGLVLEAQYMADPEGNIVELQRWIRS